jgi:hypothetical protein
LGSSGVILGPSRGQLGHLGPSSGHLGPSWCDLGHLGFTLAIQGRHLGAMLGPFSGYLGPCRAEVVKHMGC